jgi:hypothetical protein
MPRYIVKLTHGAQDYYLEWSTVVDAPVTYGMPLEEFREYYRDEYGRVGEEDLAQRLARVEATGTSCRYPDSTADSVVEGNRAGPGETCLSKQEIIRRYCLDRDKAEAGCADQETS